jgi:hypothetical protein
MPFEPRYESALDSLLIQLGEQVATRSPPLPTAESQALQSHVAGIAECVTVAIVFLQGFEAIAASGSAHLKVSQAVERWVASVPRSQSGGRIAGMVASSICAVLEDYIRDAARTKLPSQLSRIRSVIPTLPARDADAIERLVRNVKPSVKASGADWVSALQLAFDVVLSQEEADTAVDMIALRNVYVHNPASVATESITGERTKCWATSAIALCHRVALA